MTDAIIQWVRTTVPVSSRNTAIKSGSFALNDDGNKLSIEESCSNYGSRLIYIAVISICSRRYIPDGKQGFTVFSGVFQVGANVPYTNTVDVFADKHSVNNTFTQYLNHYHSAKVALYMMRDSTNDGKYLLWRNQSV